jgi:hypothetical protein
MVVPRSAESVVNSNQPTANAAADAHSEALSQAKAALLQAENDLNTAKATAEQLQVETATEMVKTANERVKTATKRVKVPDAALRGLAVVKLDIASDGRVSFVPYSYLWPLPGNGAERVLIVVESDFQLPQQVLSRDMSQWELKF